MPNISVLCCAKILTPQTNGELERRNFSKICKGARGAAGPPPGGLGGWKPPSKNNFLDPEFGLLGIEVEKQGFRTAWPIKGQQFQRKNLKSGSSILTFRDLASHVCEIFMRVAR